jgi:hypothetical protein
MVFGVLDFCFGKEGGILREGTVVEFVTNESPECGATGEILREEE